MLIEESQAYNSIQELKDIADDLERLLKDKENYILRLQYLGISAVIKKIVLELNIVRGELEDLSSNY